MGRWNTALAWGGFGVIAALGYLVLRRAPLTFLGYAALTYLLCFSVMREWYAIFTLAFLALAKPPAWLITGTGFVATFLALYGALNEYHRLGDALANAQAASLLALIAVGLGSALALTRRWVLARHARSRPASGASHEAAHRENRSATPSATEPVGAV